MGRYLALAAVLLSGCASHGNWTKVNDYQPKEIKVVYLQTRAEVAARCLRHPSSGIDGCAFPRPDVCYIILGPRWNMCLLQHERAHCAGWIHDDRPTFTQDCGPVT